MNASSREKWRRWVWHLSSSANKGMSNPVMQVTVAKPVTQVAQPDKFWNWLQRERDFFPKSWNFVTSFLKCLARKNGSATSDSRTRHTTG